MEIRVSIPDQKMPEYPDYSKQFSELAKAIRDSRNDIFKEQVSSIKNIIQDKQDVNMALIDRRMAALEKILGEIPKILRESQKEKEDKKDDGELINYLRSAQKTTNELVRSLSNRDNMGEVNSKLSSLERRLEKFSLPNIIVNAQPRLQPYPA